MYTNGVDIAVLVETWLHWVTYMMTLSIYRDILSLAKIGLMAVRVVAF